MAADLKPDSGPGMNMLQDFQFFQLAAIASLVDNLRFRIHHLEVTMKGDKAGPYEASQIPPALTPLKAFQKLKDIWRGCADLGPELDDVLMGVVRTRQSTPSGAQNAAERHVAVPGIDTDLPFELEGEERASRKQRPKPRRVQDEPVVSLQTDAESKDEGPAEDEDSGVIELEAE